MSFIFWNSVLVENPIHELKTPNQTRIRILGNQVTNVPGQVPQATLVVCFLKGLKKLEIDKLILNELSIN